MWDRYQVSSRCRRIDLDVYDCPRPSLSDFMFTCCRPRVYFYLERGVGPTSLVGFFGSMLETSLVGVCRPEVVIDCERD